VNWPQFRLKSLFAFTTLVAVVCGNAWSRVEGQRKAQQAILEANGLAYVNAPEKGTWLNRIGLGELNHRMVAVGFSHRAIVFQQDGPPQIYFDAADDLELQPVGDLELFFFFTTLSVRRDYPCLANDDTLLKLKDVGHQIEILDLENPAFTDAAMRHIRFFPNLSALRLSNTSITDEGLKCLANHCSLRYLQLDHTRVTDEGLKVLATMPRLVQVSLHDTRTTEAAVNELMASQPDVTFNWH
jgi:hypothetical protein